MLVRQSTYNDALRRAAHAEAAFYTLQRRWNDLVGKVNKRGGEDFLKHAVLKPPSQFSAEELTKLIYLCHPDKHDGKPMATDMTQKLLAVKEKVK